ncbi:hypothetical protein AO1008_05048 [Aspergillus oryzae 100-8]|nr:hypothetical protein AO1008_05048 [Aspergillus oryzae 100-8]
MPQYLGCFVMLATILSIKVATFLVQTVLSGSGPGPGSGSCACSSSGSSWGLGSGSSAGSGSGSGAASRTSTGYSAISSGDAGGQSKSFPGIGNPFFVSNFSRFFLSFELSLSHGSSGSFGAGSGSAGGSGTGSGSCTAKGGVRRPQSSSMPG